MIIRAAIPGDASQLADLMKEVEKSNFMLFDPGERKTTGEELRKRIEATEAAATSSIFLAEDNGTLAGYLFAIGNKLNRTRHSVYVVVGVGERYRGKRVGTLLFNALEKWAREHEIHRLELTVIAHNNAGRNLYEKMGFEIEGIKRDSLWIDGEFVNEYYMAKILK